MDTNYLGRMKRSDFELNVKKTCIFKDVTVYITFDGSNYNYVIEDFNLKGSCESLKDLQSEIADKIYDAK